MKPVLTVPMFTPAVLVTVDGLVGVEWLYYAYDEGYDRMRRNFLAEAKEWIKYRLKDDIANLAGAEMMADTDAEEPGWREGLL